MASYLSTDVHTIQRSIVNHVEYTLASTRFDIDERRAYLAAAHSCRDRLIESFNDTQQHFDETDCKRVSYLSLEFLLGRMFQNALLNMDIDDNYKQALKELGFNLEILYEQERDPALGNGGLGRLAACFLDSMATLDLPAFGYGIRYTYGIFRQEINDGYQQERPDYWLTYGNPWEIERPDVSFPVRFYGTVSNDPITGRCKWEGGEVVHAVAYDTPIPGHDTFNTINLRLWKAVPGSEFDLAKFNEGDYVTAVNARQRAETITSVLYPSDSTRHGKELRLKQQYFFVCATLQDLITKFRKRQPDRPWTDFPKKNAIQLNDTHPSIGIPELYRILVDEEGLSFDDAAPIVQATFSYTNHTVLPEALEMWSTEVLGNLLPRHLQIIYEINFRFLQEVERRFPGDTDRLARYSLINEQGQKSVRMANLSICCSHTVNGVADLHSKLIITDVFPHFYELWPEKFQNKTNGVTPRRWIHMANPRLSALLTDTLGSEEWIKELGLVSGIKDFADDDDFKRQWMEVKAHNKRRLAALIQRSVGITVNPRALFDVHVKRIHEYKRQLLNCLYVIYRYQQIKAMSSEQRRRVVPRVTMFAGKAAPAYVMAKHIIKLIHDVGAVVNNDPDVGDLLKVIFIPDYNVSNAEIIIPASDISQHISTAGTEASGTSNMKFAMNGGLILGTMDGANVEMAEEIGEENMFIFGALPADVATVRHELKYRSPKPLGAAMAIVLDMLNGGVFCPRERIQSILDCLRPANDNYILTADFPSYVAAQERVDAAFRDQDEWARMSILTAGSMGKFSTDRTIAEYARDIWQVEQQARPDPRTATMQRVRSFPNMDPNALLNQQQQEEDQA